MVKTLVNRDRENDKKLTKKLMKSTKIVRTQSSTMDQSLPILCQLVKMNQKLPKIYQN